MLPVEQLMREHEALTVRLCQNYNKTTGSYSTEICSTLDSSTKTGQLMLNKYAKFCLSVKEFQRTFKFFTGCVLPAYSTKALRATGMA